MMNDYLIVGYPRVLGLNGTSSTFKAEDDRGAIEIFDSEKDFGIKWKDMAFVELYRKVTE